jgi:WD40 repeat protein
MSRGERTHVLLGHRSAVFVASALSGFLPGANVPRRNALALKNGVIVSASGDREVRVWSSATGECLRTLTGHLGGVAALFFDGHHAATGSSDATVRLTDIVTGDCLVEIGTPDPGGERFRTPYAARPGDAIALWAAGETAGLPPILGHAHTGASCSHQLGVQC